MSEFFPDDIWQVIFAHASLLFLPRLRAVSTRLKRLVDNYFHHTTHFRCGLSASHPFKNGAATIELPFPLFEHLRVFDEYVLIITSREDLKRAAEVFRLEKISPRNYQLKRVKPAVEFPYAIVASDCLMLKECFVVISMLRVDNHSATQPGFIATISLDGATVLQQYESDPPPFILEHGPTDSTVFYSTYNSIHLLDVASMQCLSKITLPTVFDPWLELGDTRDRVRARAPTANMLAKVPGMRFCPRSGQLVVTRAASVELYRVFKSFRISLIKCLDCLVLRESQTMKELWVFTGTPAIDAAGRVFAVAGPFDHTPSTTSCSRLVLLQEVSPGAATAKIVYDYELPKKAYRSSVHVLADGTFCVLMCSDSGWQFKCI